MMKYVLIFVSVLKFSSYAQYCTPTANCSDDDFINNFTFNTISNLNSGGSNCFTNSYINTGISTTVTQGNKYAISMQSGVSWPEGFGVWIDYNQDFDFVDVGEFVYASPTAGTNLFTDSVLIPLSAIPGNTRLRVRCRYNQTVTNTQSCITFNWGETEDYTVNILQGNIPPAADFIASATISCNGIVSFTDLSANSPTSWLWDFGDGTTSSAQNPAHTYTIDSVYTVTLIACNAFGCDTLLKANYITVNISGGGPLPSSCTPATLSYCCGFGILNVTFNTINFNSANAVDGYKDYTCSQGTNVTAGQSYGISVNVSGANPGLQNVRAWIDYDNNGVLDSISELVFQANSVLNASGTVAIPSAAVLNTPLRFRVSADYELEAPPTPCNNLVRGQAEDYSVTVLPNTNPPIAAFNANPTVTCDGLVNFYDGSTNVPTFWLWDFGDSTTSILQNPSHIYTANGIYTVKLIVNNAYGSDTITYINLINVTIGAGPVVPSCTPATLSYCCDYGITNVTLNAINNTSADGIDGYQDYSCTIRTYLNEGQSYSISIGTPVSNTQDVRVWIDFNNDSVFAPVNELVFSANDAVSPTGTIVVPFGAFLNTPLRMRVSADFSGSAPAPCYSPFLGQVEDYTVIIGNPPIAGFLSSDTLFCKDTCINFTDLSANNPTGWSWSFPGATPSSSTAQNPADICYPSPGTYNVSLTAVNSHGTDVENKNSFITVISCDPPVAGFSSSDSMICEGACVNFTDLSANNPTGWSWLFPGATTSSSTNQNPVNICYDTSGTYDVTLIATNAYGSDTITQTGFITVTFCPPPVTGFSSSDSVICEGACVDFTDLSTNALSWNWSFPGATPSSSTSQNPVNICYPNPGNYDVTLIASNMSGSDTLTKTGMLIVLSCPVPVANFSASDSVICKNDCISFTDLSTNNPTSWNWILFGATPSSSIAQHPVNICYPNSGVYYVSLVASNANGSDTETKTAFITVDQCVGIDEVELVIYDLPSIIYDLRVYDVLGREILKSKIVNRKSEIDLSVCPTGMYFIRYISNDMIINKKILIKN